MTKCKFYDDCLFILHLNITRFRRERGWTQEQLAERAGISVRHLANLEAPHSSAAPSFAVLCQLAYALEIEPSVLIQAESNALQAAAS